MEIINSYFDVFGTKYRAYLFTGTVYTKDYSTTHSECLGTVQSEFIGRNVCTSDGPNIRIRKCEYSHVFLLFVCANIKKKIAFANIINKHSVVFFTQEVHKVINSMSPYPYSIML